MKTIFAPILTLAAIAAAAPVLAQPYPVNPGYWETQTSFLGMGGAPEHWCIKPKDINKFLSGPSNHIYHCTYPISATGGGVIHFEGTCVDKRGQTIKLRGGGAYTPTTVHMKASGTTQLLGVAIGGDATVEGRFLSEACPADAKVFE